jgi:deoxyribonuclease V
VSIVCLDVDYRGDQAHTGWVAFQDWSDASPLAEGTVVSVGAADYQPGEFYRRELPPLLKTLSTFSTLPEGIVVDGFCWLGQDRPGLGAHLYEALGRQAWVVGVAKRPFQGNPGVPVERGSTRPLWVTACGLSPEKAAGWVQSMHGPYRLPTLLKRVDQLSRVI